MITVDKENGTVNIIIDLEYAKNICSYLEFKVEPTDEEYMDFLKYLAESISSKGVGIRIKARLFFEEKLKISKFLEMRPGILDEK